MKDAIQRAARTFLQGFVGILAIVTIPPLRQIIEAAIGGNAVELIVDVWQSIVIAASAGGLIALISFAHNELENTGKVRSLLKDREPTQTT